MSNLIERAQGQGRVFSGERFIAEVQYDVRVYQNYDETLLLSGQRTRTPTVQDIKLDITERIEAAFNERLTLHMADGRKLDFWALGGEYKATGGPH
jgi:hypothetical protein